MNRNEHYPKLNSLNICYTRYIILNYICLLFIAIWIALIPLSVQAQQSPTRQSVQDGVLRFGFRIDAPPFSYCAEPKDCPDGKCAVQSESCNDGKAIDGYTVRLCQWIGDRLKQRPQPLVSGSVLVREYEFVPVTVSERFRQLESNRIDVLCEAATVTLERLRSYRSSLYIFLSGASVLYRQGIDIEVNSDLAGRQVGVLKDTTTQSLLAGIQRRAEQGEQSFNVTPAESHKDAAQRLRDTADGKASNERRMEVYFADREILLWLLRTQDLGKDYEVSESYFSLEPYALFVGKDNADLQYEVNRALVELYTDHPDVLTEIFAASFGGAEPSSLLRALFQIHPILEDQPLPQ